MISKKKEIKSMEMESFHMKEIYIMARIKKIMQTDEDIGKIAMAVPVLVSKALELFLQDLCDRTYDITVQRGAKTVNSLHLKQCVHTYNVFDFLKEIVSKVPDFTNSDAADTSKRRRVIGNETNESDEEFKRGITQEIWHTNGGGVGGRGRGKGRRRGRERGSRAIERELPRSETKAICTTTTTTTTSEDNVSNCDELTKEDNKATGTRSFDLNAQVDDRKASTSSTVAAASDTKCEDFLTLSEIDRLPIGPIHVMQPDARSEEEEEDYDEDV